MTQDHQEEMLLKVSLALKNDMDLTANQDYLASRRQRKTFRRWMYWNPETAWR